MHRLNAFTLNLTGGVGVTAINGLVLEVQAPTIAANGATTVTTASTIYLRPITAGANITITNSRMIDTSVAGCFLTAAGVWTDASTREAKENIRPVDYNEMPKLLRQVEMRRFNYKDPSDGGIDRFGLIAEEVPDFLASQERKGIAAKDIASFALAGVKFMHHKMQAMEREVKRLKRELATLVA